ncbi:hypothetical protein AAHB45_08940 [Pediococcus pentosaceus]|uniref:hypothetical protein n=1 Tax=Pediococcus pentosaceus TaxID=1255 RepID=UPI003161E7DA
MMWEDIDNMLCKNNYVLSDALYNDIFNYIRPKIETLASRAHYRALTTGICIPKNDFISYFEEAVWRGIDFYVNSLHDIKKYELSHILTHRIKIAEASVWRTYKNRGTTSDKNHEQYLDGKWLPLKNEPSTTPDILEEMNLYFQIKKFKARYPTDGAILDMLATGYAPKEICSYLFKSTVYSAKYRKKINRTRKKFMSFLS